MPNLKGSNRSHDPVPRREATSTPVGVGPEPTQVRALAATQYWQAVAAAGRSAKPATASQAHGAMPGRQRVSRV
jgi:hypothetical protein